MSELLQQWQCEDAAPTGHRAPEIRKTGRLVGGAALLAWRPGRPGGRLAARAYGIGHGYAAEAGSALARWSMHEAGVEEVFALVGPGNTRATATAKRIGMEWIGETELHHQQRLELYRLRNEDLGYCETCEGKASVE